QAMDPCQQPALTPLHTGKRNIDSLWGARWGLRLACEMAAQDQAGGFDAQQGLVDLAHRQTQQSGQRCRGGWTKMREPTGNHGFESIFLRRRFSFERWQLVFELCAGIDGGEGLGFFGGNPEPVIN